MNGFMVKTIKELMLKRNLSANAVSLASGVPQSTISRFLKGTHDTLTLENTVKLADFFGLTVSELIGEREIVQKNYDLSIIDILLESIQSYETKRSISFNSKEKKDIITNVYDAIEDLPHPITNESIQAAVNIICRTISSVRQSQN